MKTQAQIAQEKKLSKPRNPLVAQVLFKKAGAHQASRKTERQQGKKALRQAFDEGFSGRQQKCSPLRISAGDLFFQILRSPFSVEPDEDFSEAARQGALKIRAERPVSVLEGLKQVKGALWVKNWSHSKQK